jgi:hypothetical protein
MNRWPVHLHTAATAGLVQYIKSNQNGAFGFDFPFGLPRDFVHEKTWEDFVLGFPSRYKSPEAFREACRRKRPSRELKRKTDIEAHTPFSPYNLRLFRQTYYGISKVLFLLVQDKSACVLPFDKPVAGKPWVLEVCPASTLKRLLKDAVPPYKGPEEEKRKNRRQILRVVKDEGVVFEKAAALEENIIANKGGDALDSVIAALATFKSWSGKLLTRVGDKRVYEIEGYVVA